MEDKEESSRGREGSFRKEGRMAGKGCLGRKAGGRFSDHSVVVRQEKVGLLGAAAVVENIKEGF